MTEPRPWNLVAPWYHWHRQLAELGLPPRQTRPVFQKFDHSDFVKGFTKDPQRSLKFQDDVDRVFNVKLTDVPKPVSGPFVGKFTRIYAPNKVPKNTSLIPTGIRKIYLDTHKRYYLVVCELHCDAPGFPMTTPDQVCQAGFVVRRRSFDFPHGAKKEAVVLLQQIVGIQTEIARLEQTFPAKGMAARRRAQAIQKMREEGSFEAYKADLHEKLVNARKDLLQWKDANGVVSIHEGWIASEFQNIGSWQPIEDKPEVIVESTFPLYPVFPDQNIPNHSAKGKNIYFGVLPSSSFDTDARGSARFDDQTLYEIRCFVRRHKLDCPRSDEIPDCPGELVWSEPSESYKLASHSDLIGTSQRPITIQMPNLEELAAQVAAFPSKRFSPLKVVQPQSLKFDVDDGKASVRPPPDGGIGGSQICFFAIPLLTIVAYFVFSLFLPILVFLFGLFFLLQLKFCILPSVQIDAGLKAELDLIPPSIDVDADFDLSLGLGFTASDLNADLKDGIAADIGVTGNAVAEAQLDVYSNVPLMPIAQGIKNISSLPPEAADSQGPDLVGSLEFEPRISVEASIS